MRIRALLPLLFTAISFAAETGFLDREVSVNGQLFRYQVYVPRDYRADRAWPVILFLHGAGESGDNGLTQTLIGLPAAIRKNPERFPAIAVLPQSSPKRWWTDTIEQDQALAALDKSMREFHADPDRVYLTGLSKGGFGTWHLAGREPGRFAAIAPICGGVALPKPLLERFGLKESEFPTNEEMARKIGAKMPVWVFHGADDKTVPAELSREMTSALKALGSGVKYTEYEGVGHNSWDKAYGDPEFATWLLAQRKMAASSR